MTIHFSGFQIFNELFHYRTLCVFKDKVALDQATYFETFGNSTQYEVALDYAGDFLHRRVPINLHISANKFREGIETTPVVFFRKVNCEISGYVGRVILNAIRNLIAIRLEKNKSKSTIQNWG